MHVIYSCLLALIVLCTDCLGLTTRLIREITQVNLWCIVSCENLACNNACEVNLRVKVDLWLANL